ncbi:MAG TPA: bifunctional phosphoribosyl-AMP cyclohydrolase/phosphoribosyl-ATP diphosphatase HisIE [Rhodanobacteraceae bacterium]
MSKAIDRVDEAAVDWAKSDGLVPAIVQHAVDGRVLMLGYMNREALQATQDSGHVTFFSRSKQRLWMKGESSGHVLDLVSVHVDCDADTLLVLALPQGPTCHTGAATCFGDDIGPALAFLGRLDALVAQRHAERPAGSYTTQLFESGTRRIAQKVGEEGVETALAAVAQGDDDFIGEGADLVYHLLVLLRARGLGLADVVDKLQSRHKVG